MRSSMPTWLDLARRRSCKPDDAGANPVVGPISRWCNGAHGTLLKSKSWFDSRSGYFTHLGMMWSEIETTMRRNDEHRTGVGAAGGIGAMLLAMLSGVARHADDVGRGVLRHADDFGRAGFHQVDDFGRTGLGLHHSDDVGGALWHANDDALRLVDDGHRWPATDEAENIGRFKAECELDVAMGDIESVVSGLEHHITKEALKQSVMFLEDVAEEQEE